ncbi:Polycomb complex protein BMI-1-B like protein [Argiope bruennichi]|uniref:Polycomb complex protein BMI-1-B like protein n=1 Tax=Argiope bruennichi TaxID=94029 RepID=A0A8T0FEX1_ARGBR|nr:Polycomb complex protein BMI-1-B like protein [Argiope bruennichi]
MHRTTRLKITDLNQHFICVLCDGYLIDATTIVECLHSFCRTCIVRYLENSRFCPVCDVQVHKTKPLQSIRSDTTLQDVVYKLIPGLYQNEMQRRREFYSEHPEEAAKCSSEERGEGAEQRCFYSPKENISVMLEYFQGTENGAASDTDSNSDNNSKELMTRYLNCPAALTVANMKKFIRMKYSLPLTYRIELMYSEHLLIDDYTLMDIAYIYSWRRAGPMKFLYTFSHRKYLPKRVLEPIQQADTEIPPHNDIVSDPVVIPNVSEDSDSSNKVNTEDSAMDESDESNKPVAETNATEDSTGSSSNSVAVANAVDESNTDSNAPVAVTSTVEEADGSKSHQPVIPSAEPEKMEVDVPTSESSCVTIPNIPTWAPAMKVEATYAPQTAVFPPTNGIKLKLVPLPDNSPKARSKKSAGRKGGRTRYKSTPVQRFPRLAPYPPKPHPTTSATCLSTPNMPPLPQITMGKLVPSVITTLPPNIVTALVSTTANSMCDVTKNSTMLPTATFLSQPPLCTHSNTFAAVPNFIPSSSSSVNTILPNVSGAGMTVKPILAQTVVGNAVSSSETTTLPTTTILLNAADNKNTVSQPTSALSSATIVSSASTPTCTSSSEINTSKEQPVVSAPVTVMPSMPIISIAPSQPTPMEVSTVDVTVSKEKESPSILKTALSEDQPRDSKTPTPKTIPNGIDGKIECNGIKDSASLTPVKDSLFCDNLTPEKKASKAFEMSVKNSISAEFSDNDDLGCQPDLVVDEQKMDSSDNEDDTDTALRKKITAIAEKDDEADDTEADSGRASDISSQARSSCDDDIGSPMNTMPVSETVTSSTSSRLPTFTLAVSSAPATSTDNSLAINSRSVKSNKINSVINNLYLKNEKKDTHGALDLSTCTKKPGEAAAARPKPVANPVLDIKHRQQTYLPAPNTNSKQHTACVPSPKHPTTSPILMHGLTAHRHNLLPSQIPGVNRKSPHLPVPTFHSSPMVYPSQTRGMSSPSCMPGRSTPTTPPSLLSHHNSPSPHASHTLSPPVPTAHQGMPAMLTGILPCMSKSVINSFPLRSATPAPSAMPPRSNSTSSNHLPESKSFFSKGLNRSLSNPSKSMVPTTNSTSPYLTTSSHKSNNSTVSGYKKSNSYKSYNGKYAVINPDPNGYQNKMLIRNLDARPNNNSQQSHKL